MGIYERSGIYPWTVSRKAIDDEPYWQAFNVLTGEYGQLRKSYLLAHADIVKEISLAAFDNNFSKRNKLS